MKAYAWVVWPKMLNKQTENVDILAQLKLRKTSKFYRNNAFQSLQDEPDFFGVMVYIVFKYSLPVCQT